MRLDELAVVQQRVEERPARVLVFVLLLRVRELGRLFFVARRGLGGLRRLRARRDVVDVAEEEEGLEDEVRGAAALDLGRTRVRRWLEARVSVVF